jgi:hypothetical protein
MCLCEYMQYMVYMVYMVYIAYNYVYYCMLYVYIIVCSMCILLYTLRHGGGGDLLVVEGEEQRAHCMCRIDRRR